jgi:nucleoside 2-deoxyribosyltransferase
VSYSRFVPFVPKVYVASPLGFSAATREFYNGVLLPTIWEADLETLDPWGDAELNERLEAILARPFGKQRYGALLAFNKEAGKRNTNKISDAHGMFAVLDGVDVDSGVAAEIGFAAAKKKPIVGLRFDTRQTGDNEAALVNLQVEYFISLKGQVIAADRKDVVRSIKCAAAELRALIPPSAG